MGKYPIKYQKGSDLALTVMQAARELGISEYAIGELIRSGQLRVIRLKKLIRVPRVAITELLEGEKPNS